MITRQDQRRRFRDLLPSIIAASVFSYFAYHATQGDRGIFAWWRISHQLASDQTTLDQLQSERRATELRVSLLRPESLDPDLLEEQARIMLNFGTPDERLLIIKDKSVDN